MGPQGRRLPSVQQVERLLNMSRSLYRDVATADEARRIYGIGEQYKSVDACCRSLANLNARKLPFTNFSASRRFALFLSRRDACHVAALDPLRDVFASAGQEAGALGLFRTSRFDDCCAECIDRAL